MSRASNNRRYLATHLGAVLETQGRKQRWLAERIGVSCGYVSLIIAGERTVDREMGERVAALLDVPFFCFSRSANRAKRSHEGNTMAEE